MNNNMTEYNTGDATCKMHPNEIEALENRLKPLEAQAERWLAAYELAKEAVDAARKALEAAK